MAAEVNMIRRKRLPPNVERRGPVLHTVYDVLIAELTNSEELRQNHEQKAPEACTEFVAGYVATDELRPIATVSWMDDCAIVEILRVKLSDRLREASKNAVTALLSSWETWEPAARRAEFIVRRLPAGATCMTSIAQTPTAAPREEQEDAGWRARAQIAGALRGARVGGCATEWFPQCAQSGSHTFSRRDGGNACGRRRLRRRTRGRSPALLRQVVIIDRHRPWAGLVRRSESAGRPGPRQPRHHCRLRARRPVTLASRAPSQTVRRGWEFWGRFLCPAGIREASCRGIGWRAHLCTSFGDGCAGSSDYLMVIW